MLVRFLSANTYKAHCIAYPLVAFAQQLKQAGITVKFHYRPDPALADCDVLCVSTEVFGKNRWRARWPGRNEFLEHIRPQVKTIIWFDATDGTGTTSFGVLPYVDLYAKGQLLKDRSLYMQPLYSGRHNSAYYHQLLGIEDQLTVGSRALLPPDQINKLDIFWNLGLGDWHAPQHWKRYLRMLVPWANYRYSVTAPQTQRNIQVAYRASDHSKLATLAYQRQETRRRLAQLAAAGQYRIAYQGMLSYQQYKQELQQAMLVASPFGLGEICPRDFDCFLAGAALFKPDMGHHETWPEYYLPDSTYVPYAWDFSDFEEQLIGLIENPARARQIAQAGQERFLHYLSPAGGEDFVQQFARLLAQAEQNAHHPTRA